MTTTTLITVLVISLIALLFVVGRVCNCIEHCADVRAYTYATQFTNKEVNNGPEL